MTVYDDRLNTFIYLLLRDHVTFGVMEKVLQDLGDKSDFELCEKEQARYSSRLRMKIQHSPTPHNHKAKEQPMCPHGLRFTCSDCKPLPEDVSSDKSQVAEKDNGDPICPHGMRYTCSDCHQLD